MTFEFSKLPQWTLEYKANQHLWIRNRWLPCWIVDEKKGTMDPTWSVWTKNARPFVHNECCLIKPLNEKTQFRYGAHASVVFTQEPRLKNGKYESRSVPLADYLPDPTIHHDVKKAWKNSSPIRTFSLSLTKYTSDDDEEDADYHPDVEDEGDEGDEGDEREEGNEGDEGDEGDDDESESECESEDLDEEDDKAQRVETKKRKRNDREKLAQELAGVVNSDDVPDEEERMTKRTRF